MSRRAESAFVDDEALHAALAPHMTRAAFLRAVGELEHRGFPKPHPMFKGRYMPAVERWLDVHAGGGAKQISPAAADGPETWGDGDAIANTRAKKAQARGGSDAILERGGTLPERRETLPGPPDPFTARRHARGH